MLRICNFEQALNACFPRKRCLDGTYVLTGSARLLLRVQTLHHLQRFVMHVWQFLKSIKWRTWSNFSTLQRFKNPFQSARNSIFPVCVQTLFLRIKHYKRTRRNEINKSTRQKCVPFPLKITLSRTHKNVRNEFDVRLQSLIAALSNLRWHESSRYVSTNKRIHIHSWNWKWVFVKQFVNSILVACLPGISWNRCRSANLLTQRARQTLLTCNSTFSFEDMTDVVQFFNQLPKIPSECQFSEKFWVHLKQFKNDISVQCAQTVYWDKVYFKLRTLPFQVWGTHHQVQKIRTFHSNIVNLIILTHFVNSKKNLICREPLSISLKKTTILGMILWMKSCL